MAIMSSNLQFCHAKRRNDDDDTGQRGHRVVSYKLQVQASKFQQLIAIVGPKMWAWSGKSALECPAKWRQKASQTAVVIIHCSDEDHHQRMLECQSEFRSGESQVQVNER